MKIGYFTTAFPCKNPSTRESTGSYIGGGVENVTYNLALQMGKRGHDVYIFTSSMNNAKDSIEKYGNITIYRYKNNFKIGQSPISSGLIFKPLFSNIDLDIVHSQLGNLPAPLTAYFYAKKKKKPLITTYHEDWIKGFGSLFRKVGVALFDGFIADILLSASNIILTPSQYYINHSMHLSKISKKVCAVPNGIDFEDFHIDLGKHECRKKLGLPLDKKIILFVGSLTPRKAPNVLIEAMSLIVKNYQDCHLVFVGSGNYIKELKSMAKELKLERYITFTGFVDDDVKYMYYHSSDIFVLPSISEGFGIVLLEASACGLPLITSNLVVFKSIVQEGENGYFTKTGDYIDLGNKILFLLQNEDVRLKMGEKSKKNASKFSWERVAEQTEQIYSQYV